MPVEFDLAPSAAELTRLTGGIQDAQLTNPTPASYPVATLLEHLDGLSLAFRVAVTDGIDLASDGPAPDGARLAAGWRSQLPERLHELTEVWRAPTAWEQPATVAGVTLPGEVVARVVLTELVLHGWDLARGTGQAFRCDPASIGVVLDHTASIPDEEAHRSGLFGPVVPVPSDAPRLHRALGFAGRDPRWSLPAGAVHAVAPRTADDRSAGVPASDGDGQLAQPVGVEAGPAMEAGEPTAGDR